MIHGPYNVKNFYMCANYKHDNYPLPGFYSGKSDVVRVCDRGTFT